MIRSGQEPRERRRNRPGVRVVMSIVLAAALVGWIAVRATRGGFETAPWTSVVRVELVPIPEGSPPPPFEDPLRSPVSYELARLGPYAPAELPAPVDQHGCDTGGDLVATLADGRTITYGPCRLPPAIDHLWAGIEFVLSNGDCAPRCGRGGAPGP